MTTHQWPRDRFTGVGGGIFTGGGGEFTGVGGGRFSGVGGGMFTGVGGGMFTGPGGGLWTGAGDNHYMSNTPPMDVFIVELRLRGLHQQADLLARAHGLNL